MRVLKIVLVAAAALLAIWHATGNPPNGRPTLWISVVLLCVLAAIDMVGR